ncbi:transposase [Marinobacterium rhizophilum]|uniref:Transposase n=1 Tax=Marinobacterium rhizophilum TaxID=420402 RepID=A0ABY5HJ47_9GAMM|nr:transposase [Marinobacterium rhizophilum]
MVEQISYNLLYRWFVGLTIDDPVWHHSSFSTCRHGSYQVSMQLRKQVEEPFGRGKEIGPIRQVMLRGRDKVHSLFQLTMMGWKLLRMRNLQR